MFGGEPQKAKVKLVPKQYNQHASPWAVLAIGVAAVGLILWRNRGKQQDEDAGTSTSQGTKPKAAARAGGRRLAGKKKRAAAKQEQKKATQKAREKEAVHEEAPKGGCETSKLYTNHRYLVNPNAPRPPPATLSSQDL